MGLRLAAFEALQHGGVVEFGSAEPGVWRVRLVVRDPVVAADADDVRRQPTSGDRRARLRVLVVDDHDVVHWGFRVLLGEQPWVQRCLAAKTGAGALEILRSFPADVALVDLFLNGESGADVCDFDPQGVAARRGCCSSPGRGGCPRPPSRAAGASGFVSKDWEAREVARAVRRVGLGAGPCSPPPPTSRRRR